MRSFYIALGIVTLVFGLFLLFAGYVHIGCTVGGTSTNPTYTNCGGALDLEIIGGIFTIAAIVMFAVSFIPYDTATVR